jgi:hypothetical protein
MLVPGSVNQSVSAGNDPSGVTQGLIDPGKEEKTDH